MRRFRASTLGHGAASEYHVIIIVSARRLRQHHSCAFTDERPLLALSFSRKTAFELKFQLFSLFVYAMLHHAAPPRDTAARVAFMDYSSPRCADMQPRECPRNAWFERAAIRRQRERPAY